MNNNPFIWTAEVRDYEVDYQGIVNNAHYFHYFDHARAVYSQKILGLNVQECADNNINIILLKTEILFKFPLKYGDVFCVTSRVNRISRFKFQFKQEIYIEPNKKISAESQSIIASITKDGKPCLPDAFNKIKYQEQQVKA